MAVAVHLGRRANESSLSPEQARGAAAANLVANIATITINAPAMGIGHRIGADFAKTLTEGA